MAKLPILKRFLAEDYQSAGAWITKFLYVLNLFAGSVYAALNNGLTLQDNMLAQVNTVSISGSSPKTTINWSYSSKPVGVLLINILDASSQAAIITSPTTVAWSYGAGVITINNITGLTSGKSYTATFWSTGG